MTEYEGRREEPASSPCPSKDYGFHSGDPKDSDIMFCLKDLGFEVNRSFTLLIEALRKKAVTKIAFQKCN